MGAVMDFYRSKITATENPSQGDAAALRTELQENAENAAYEYGHSYSGSIGEKQSLNIHMQVFSSHIEAEDHIEQEADKYGPAIAVRYREEGKLFWLVGGLCAS